METKLFSPKTTRDEAGRQQTRDDRFQSTTSTQTQPLIFRRKEKLPAPNRNQSRKLTRSTCEFLYPFRKKRWGERDFFSSVGSSQTTVSPSPVAVPLSSASSSRVKSQQSTTQHHNMDSCPLVKNLLLLDSEGKRVAVKYFSDDWPANNVKLAFEKSVFTKTQKANARAEAEIAMFDGCIVVYKFINDLHFFVTAGEEENELILASVLQGFFDAVGLLLRNDVEKRVALENLDMILLCIDEIVDRGIILETDAETIAGKVASNGVDGSVPFSEQTITQALATAREHLARSLLK